MDKPKHIFLNDYDDSTKAGERWLRYDGKEYGQAPSRGKLTYKEKWLNTASNPVEIPIERYGYDPYGNINNYTNPRGYTTLYYYGPTNTFLSREVNAKSHQTSYSYDEGTGNLLSVSDPNGYTTNYQYDVFGRRIKEIKEYDSFDYPTLEIKYGFDGMPPEEIKIIQREVKGAPQTYDTYTYYDGFGNPIQNKRESATPKWITKDTIYDGLFRIKKRSNPYLSDTLYFSDIADSSSDPSSDSLDDSPDFAKRAEYSYDPLGRISQITNADGTKKIIEYDHWKETIYDENAKKKDRIYDAYSRVAAINEYNDKNNRRDGEKDEKSEKSGGKENEEIYQTHYEYDALNNLKEVRDNKKNKIRYTYDSLGRKTQLDDPDMGRWKYSYDKNGNLVNQTDNKGNPILMQYDELDRLTRKNASGIVTDYYYDSGKIGVLDSITHQGLSSYFQYDHRLRVVNEQKTMDRAVFTISYDYDSMDRLLSKRLPDGRNVTYSYDTQGTINSISSTSRLLTNIGYNELNQPTQRRYSNGLTTEFEYNLSNYRLNRLITEGREDLSDSSYNYDNVGNVVGITDSIHSKKDLFQYDGLNRLVNAQRNSDFYDADSHSNYSNFDISYDYDSIGNLVSLNSSSTNVSFIYSSSLSHSPTAVEYNTLCDKISDGRDGSLLCLNEKIRECGSGACKGSQMYENGKWGLCSSEGKDCGVCCKCSSDGQETYDWTQFSDCNLNECDYLDGCYAYGNGCEERDYYDKRERCIALKECSSSGCTVYSFSNTQTDTSCKGTGVCSSDCVEQKTWIDYACSGNLCLGTPISCDNTCSAGTHCVDYGNLTYCNSVSETCNNLDDDCDGIIDEELTRATTCGVGKCSGNTGFERCSLGAWVNNTCNPLQGASLESCDGLIDEDCDGSIDEGCDCTTGSKRNCSLQQGVCSGSTETCSSEGKWPGCSYSSIPDYNSTDGCDGKDNDCDGITDEDYSSQSTSCGVGACYSTGSTSCVDGKVKDTCTALQPSNEVCDNVDNDCDGITDEGCVEFSLRLNKGWNLISLPLESNKTVSEIFGLNKLYYLEDNKWRELKGGDKLIYSYGYWVELNESNKSSLVIEGLRADKTRLNIKKGWNLIGLPLEEEKEVRDVFGEVMGDIEVVMSFKDGEWKSFNPLRPEMLNSLKTLRPGMGVFVKAGKNAEWEF